MKKHFFRVIAILAMSALSAQAGSKTVKVFLLAGQSNMEGHGKVTMGRSTDPSDNGKESEGRSGVFDHRSQEQQRYGQVGECRWLYRRA